MTVLVPEMQNGPPMSKRMRFVGLACCMVLAALQVSPALARADDPRALTTKLVAAAAGVNSFVVQMKVTGATGVSGSLTFVRPMRIKSEFTGDATSVETYFVDGTVYTHLPGGWQKTKIDGAHAPPQSVNIAEGLTAATVTVLPDRTEDGASVGLIEVETSVAPAGGLTAQAAGSRMVCSYDKTSYLLRVCTNGIMTMTYTKYNDPTNVVELPPEARSARTVRAAPPPVRSAAPDSSPPALPPAFLDPSAAAASPAAGASPAPRRSARGRDHSPGVSRTGRVAFTLTISR